MTTSVSPARRFPASPEPPGGAPPAAGIITGHRELLLWQDGALAEAAKVEQYAERALATPHGTVVVAPRTAVLIRPGGERVLLATVPDSGVALSADGRHLAIAGVDLPADITARPRFLLSLADLADGSVTSVECLAMPSIDSLRDGTVYYRVRTGDQDTRAALAWAPGREPAPARSPADPGPRVAARLSADEPYVLTGTEGTPLAEIGMSFGARLSPGRQWLYEFRRQPLARPAAGPVTLSVAAVSGDSLGPRRDWPLPPGCATAWGGNRRPTWEDEDHLLLVTPQDTIPGTRVIRIDVTSGAIERADARRADGSAYDAEVFVEPLIPPGSRTRGASIPEEQVR